MCDDAHASNLSLPVLFGPRMQVSHDTLLLGHRLAHRLQPILGVLQGQLQSGHLRAQLTNVIVGQHEFGMCCGSLVALGLHQAIARLELLRQRGLASSLARRVSQQTIYLRAQSLHVSGRGRRSERRAGGAATLLVLLLVFRGRIRSFAIARRHGREWVSRFALPRRRAAGSHAHVLGLGGQRRRRWRRGTTLLRGLRRRRRRSLTQWQGRLWASTTILLNTLLLESIVAGMIILLFAVIARSKGPWLRRSLTPRRGKWIELVRQRRVGL